ncbi:hypothetical protein QTH91_11555 [Variovorax dokdonensis]|uniref:Uncharacterized protein n=1 Tax=Variovorax dokdonensis TaxID=344883 RepID=A0ABT7NAZ7_9BURK|nr:hypothetical protein [Variovorax dokdonensis]MDM0045120.1 hypothetical protein [Variovorax dokdonensis]
MTEHPHRKTLATGQPTASRPVRWMTVLLAVLVAGGAALALLWADQADAQSGTLLPDAAGILAAGPVTDSLRCEMVRIWPLPADCQFVFGPAPTR